MAKPYVHWRPRDNAGLHVHAVDGPLEVTAAELAKLRMMVAPWVTPSHFPFGALGYLAQLYADAGVAPREGLHVAAFPWLVDNLSFWAVNPIDGSGLPDDLSDPYAGVSVPLLALGYRLALRGWLGHNDENHFNADLEVEWADRDPRPGASPRGAWTGCALQVAEVLGEETDWLLYALHGKRPIDPNWLGVGGHIEHVWAPVANPSASAVANGIAAARVRVALAGGPPLWNALKQHDIGAGFVDLHSAPVDVVAYNPTHPERLALLGSIIAAPSGPFPPVPPADWPFDETWFRVLRTSQFEPWVIDVADWKVREWEEHHAWIAGPPPADRMRELQLPKRDLVHLPPGHPNAPAALRETDDAMGIGIVLGPETMLVASTKPDWAMVHAAVPPLRITPPGLYGRGAPFAATFRGRPRGMGPWSTERALLSIGNPWAAIPGPGIGNNGLGLFWRPTNGGEMVARCYDGSSWADAVAPFKAATRNAVAVDIALAWTGDRGLLAGRPDRELRLVIDGVTVANVRAPNMVLDDPGVVVVGAVPGTVQAFECLLTDVCLVAEASPDLELLRAPEWEHAAFANPSFEIAASSGRAGEAEDWTWESVQQVGAFAEFNALHPGFERWREGRELFDADWRFPYTWVFDTRADWLAATFTADDVGGIAWVREDDSTWRLTAAPATWAEVTTGTNDQWLADFATLAAAVFNASAPGYATTVEEFVLWKNLAVYLGHLGDLSSQPPWFDVPAWLSPPTDDPPTGWTGWVDDVLGYHYFPLALEGFEEAWGNDLFSMTVVPWTPDTAYDGILRSGPLTFPLTVHPDRAHLVVVLDLRLYSLLLTPGVYDNANDLAGMVQHIWQTQAGTGTGLRWTETDDGIAFGWDGMTPTATMAVLGQPLRTWFSDAREDLGLAHLGAHGTQSRVELPAMLTMPPLPAGIVSTDLVILDGWTEIEIATDFDPNMGGLFPLTYGMAGALFDSAISSPTYRENFRIDPGVWQDEYLPGDLTAAMFDGATTSQEDFDSTLWPDWLWP